MTQEQVNLFDDLFSGEEVEEPEQKLAPTKATYEDFDYEDLCTYAGLDTIATSSLLGKLFPSFTQPAPMKAVNLKGVVTNTHTPPIIQSYLDVEMKGHQLVLDMEINGIPYSIPKNEILGRKMRSEISELDDLIFTSVGKKFDLDSGPSVAKFLYEERGFTPPFQTKGGEPATDGMALLLLAGLDPTAGKYVSEDKNLQYLAWMAKRRDISSVHNTFIANYVKDFVKRDGKIHPSYHLVGTSSFRLSATDPNIAQLPNIKHGYNVRDCYIADPGQVFIAFDFSSCEVKVLASLAEEDSMLQAIADGLDFHCFSASKLRGLPYEEVSAAIADKTHPKHKEYKELRRICKTLTFSLQYGSSAAGIAKQLNVTKAEAEIMIGDYFKTFPGVRGFIEGSHKFAQLNQFNMTALGQIKRQYGTNSCFRSTASYNASLRNAQNFLIQSTASSMGFATFAELNRRIKPLGGIAVASIYDSFEFCINQEKASEAIEVAFDVMINYPMDAFSFMKQPIGTSGEIGTCWGDCVEVHQGVSQGEIDALVQRLKMEHHDKFGFEA